MFDEIFLHAFSHTAQHAENQSSAALFPQGIQLSQAMIDFLLGIIAHRAGVQEHGISLFCLVACLIACHLHDAGHHFRIGHVHLAAVGLYI